MTDFAIIVFLWAIMFIVAFVFIPVWRKRHDAGKGLYARTQDDNKLSVNYALKNLNCKVTWADEHEDLVARYDYQGGHFNIRLEKDSPYVRLSYFYFFEASPHNLELVRNVCNRCNLNTETCRIVYTVNSETAVIDVHIVSSLAVNDSTVTEVLERAMGNTFRWQNVFLRLYNELLPDNEKAPGHDAEKNQATFERGLVLLCEQEMTHQEAGPDWHQGQGEDTRLAHLLATTMGVTDIVPAHLALYGDGLQEHLDDCDAILNYDITQPLISGNAFARLSALARIDFYDPGDPVKMRHLTLDFEQEATTNEVLYYRITLSLAPVAPVTGVGTAANGNVRRQVSVLMGYDLTPNDERLGEFRYLWKEATAKAEEGRYDEMTDEERLLISMNGPDTAALLQSGKVLFDQKRFYEAIRLFETVYVRLRIKTSGQTKQEEAFAMKVCFFLGVSYGALAQYEKSIYYLQQINPFENLVCTKAYVNSLVNKPDHRALEIIENMLTGLQNAHDSDNDSDGEDKPPLGKGNEQIDHAYNFLTRRKAYLLVATEHYADAERMLRKMLYDPNNSDFALKELAYIQKNKGKKAAE